MPIDANTRAIAEVLRRWHEAPTAQVIDFAEARRRHQQRINNSRAAASRRPLPPRPAA